MTFEDGTRVHLNYNTTLKYPPHFGTTTRTVYLDGEAYFQVNAKELRRMEWSSSTGQLSM